MNIHKSRIELESKIINVVRANNTRGNTFHFQYDRAPLGFEAELDYVLEVITRNVMNGQLFLLKRIEGTSETDCLNRMLEYVESKYKDENNYTVIWNDKDGDEHESYFRSTNEEEVRTKFYFSGHNDATITEIKLNPIS